MPKKKTTEEGSLYSASGKKMTQDDYNKLYDDVSKLSFDPHFITEKAIEFGKALTGIPIYEYQYAPIYRGIYSVLTVEGAIITLLFSRQSGKSEAMAFMIDTLAVLMPPLAKIFPELDQYRDGIKMGLFAPQSDQMDTTYSRCMMRLTSENADLILQDPDINTELESDVRLVLSNGSYLKGQVAAKQSKIESKTYDLVIVEEAQDVDSFICQKSIEPMLSATNGTLFKVGTTGTIKNHFWFDIQDNLRTNRRVKDKRLSDHFEYDYKAIIKSKREQYEKDRKLFHLNYEKDVLKKRQRWGEDSDQFRLSYGLKWALDTGMFITDKDWKLMCNRKKGHPKKVNPNWNIVAGLDIAKSSARTVLTIGRTIERPLDDSGIPAKEIIAWVDLQGHDYETQHHEIMQALVWYNVKVLYADYTGVGKPVVDRLTYDCGEHVHIVPYTFSRPSKSDMWQSLLGDIQNRRLIVPANSEVASTSEFITFEEQMKSLLKYYEGSYLVAEASEGEYDDYPDSVALMVLAGNEVAPDAVEVDEHNPLMEDLNYDINQINNSGW